jgi:hypothetical protein
MLLSAAVVAGCGSDGGDGGDGANADTTAAPSPGAAVFESKAVGFTFEYPAELKAQRKPQGEILGQVAVERGARLNALKIRKTAEQELGTARYLDEFQRDFAQTVGRVSKREDTIGDLDVGVLEFDHSVQLGGERVAFSSASYFFAGAGKTWQLECIADERHREQIDAACKTALESVDFSR